MWSINAAAGEKTHFVGKILNAEFECGSIKTFATMVNKR